MIGKYTDGYAEGPYTCRYFAVLASLIMVFFAGWGEADGLDELSRGHFVIHHMNKRFANSVSWKAEYHYKRIVNHLGVKEFRPWEGAEKCEIYLYPSKESYLAATGASEWSAGIAHSHMSLIASFEGATDFEDGTLPHEITHVLLNKFFEGRDIPLWLNEGMAQFEEETETATYWRKRSIKEQVKSGSNFSLERLFAMNDVPEDNVELFYSQAASVVDHLLTDNIRTNYGKFLQSLKRGVSVDTALKDAYQWKYKNGVPDLEGRWRDFVKKKY